MSKDARKLMYSVQRVPLVHGTQQADEGVIMAARLQDRVREDERLGGDHGSEEVWRMYKVNYLEARARKMQA